MGGGARDLCFWRSKIDEHSAQNFKIVREKAVLIFFLEIGGVNCAKYEAMTFLFGDQACIALNLDKCVLELPTW